MTRASTASTATTGSGNRAQLCRVQPHRVSSQKEKERKKKKKKKKTKKKKKKRKKKKQHELAAGFKSCAATATAAINTHLFHDRRRGRMR
mgnify:CR=1 FL=1